MYLSGCATDPHAFDRRASTLGLARLDVPGHEFQHAVFLKPAALQPGKPLHVYLDGDGTPYIHRGLPAADPTPRDPLVIRLMALDPAPVLLLGRPCYYGLSEAANCSKTLWTSARYGDAVVQSMATALRAIAPEDRPLILIGFSGGGTLAVLLSHRLTQVVAVVTVAGNLDIDRWTDWHGYARLHSSINPVNGPRLAESVIQLHFAAAKDQEVPPALLRDAVLQLGGELLVLEHTSHADGWEHHWPTILRILDRRVQSTGRKQPETDPVRNGSERLNYAN